MTTADSRCRYSPASHAETDRRSTRRQESHARPPQKHRRHCLTSLARGRRRSCWQAAARLSSRARAATSAAADLHQARAAQRRHHPRPGLPDRHPREAADAGARREDHRRGRPGKVVGKGTSNATGRLRHRRCPGKSIDDLGKTYTVKIDKASLPKGAALRNPKQVVAQASPSSSTRTSSSPSRSATPAPPRPARRSRPCSSPSAAWCSRCCWRWPRSACR